jgi:hypothetical protein
MIKKRKMSKLIEKTSKQNINPKNTKELEDALKYLQKTSKPGLTWQDVLKPKYETDH